MDKIKLKLNADEFRLVHDLLSYILPSIYDEVRGHEDGQGLRAKLEFVILQRLFQKKLAAKVVFLQKKNVLSLTFDEAIVLYVRLNQIDISGLDDFSGAFLCSLLSVIEPKILGNVSIYGT
jgi:hypothetical protein